MNRIEKASANVAWLSPAQAARLLGITPQWVRKLAQAGQLRAIETPLGWLIDQEDAIRMAVERQHSGDQRNGASSVADAEQLRRGNGKE